MMFVTVLQRIALALLLTFWFGHAAPAVAQDVQRIAAVVNDEVVSMFDLVQRLKLVIFSSGLRNTPEVMRQIGPQVLRTLIDERLRLQEASRKKISVSETEMAGALARIERNNKIPPHTLDSFLKARGIDPETVLTQVRAQLAWMKLLGRRQRASHTVTEDDIDQELERLRASQGKLEYLLSEIFLVVASPDQDTVAQQNSARLIEQLRSGASFAALASQFSEGVTAGAGGNIGWVLESQLAEEVATTVKSMSPGQVAGPIRTNGGYLIVKLNDRRQRMIADADDAQVTLKQILLPLPAEAPDSTVAAQSARAATIRQTIPDCNAMSRTAATIAPGMSGDLGKLRLKDLPKNLREVVRDLPVGRISQPVRSKLGLHLLMVCDRVEAASSLPDRETIRNRLTDKRVELLSRSYLRDIRRSAFVDIRI
ncbi:MAG: peptidylprolyl isomerase [Alphaproteobacteria bacterium]